MAKVQLAMDSKACETTLKISRQALACGFFELADNPQQIRGNRMLKRFG
jgi:hypothetical protein